MRFHPGRTLGLIVGLAILVTVFLLPISGSQTLYGKAEPLLANTSSMQTGSNTTIASNYVTVIAFILLVIAGLVGVFPLGTGVLGVVGMAILTVGQYLIHPGSGQPAYAVAFYALWVESIVALGASFWHGKKKLDVVVQVQQSAPPSAPSTS
ncbi:MAG: hypothetical protein OK456_02615 [Thaumarchaeota archaeon]|nr:hypothetical protein [Nitrososphaerota archaeon]